MYFLQPTYSFSIVQNKRTKIGTEANYTKLFGEGRGVSNQNKRTLTFKTTYNLTLHYLYMI